VNPVVVLDASAAVRAVMDPAAQPGLLDRIAAASHVIAPVLFRAEVGNALWKYRRAGALDAVDAIDRHAEACALVDRFEDDAAMFPEALHLAIQQDHPVYDALYLVTARRHAACLVTFDRRLHERCERVRIEAERFGD
jgi:predicted nucleic acid-binding protein